jgi:glycosyltransferase involved in cell wall biosynthesis
MKGRLNIIFVMDSLYAGGGVERVTLNLLRHLSRSKFSLKLVIIGAQQDATLPVPSDVTVTFLGKRHVREAIAPLYHILATEQPDVIYSAKTLVNLAAILANRLAGQSCRIVVSEHIHLSTYLQHEAINRKWRLWPILARGIYRWADKVVCVSMKISQDIQARLRLPPSKISVIYNPVVDDLMLKKASAVINHPWFASNREKPVILAIGRLTRQKGFPYLLRAFAQVRNTIPTRLVILGEGEEYEVLLDLTRTLGIHQDVALLGFQENPYAYMAKSDAFVLSSLWEGLPTVVIEAMACGVPVVATRCPSGPEEIIMDGVNGLLIPPADTEALADAIIRLLSNPEMAQKLALAAKRRAEDFSVEKIVPQYERLFDSILRRRE